VRRLVDRFDFARPAALQKLLVTANVEVSGFNGLFAGDADALWNVIPGDEFADRGCNGGLPPDATSRRLR
jgi:hypothetical protein